MRKTSTSTSTSTLTHPPSSLISLGLASAPRAPFDTQEAAAATATGEISRPPRETHAGSDKLSQEVDSLVASSNRSTTTTTTMISEPIPKPTLKVISSVDKKTIPELLPRGKNGLSRQAHFPPARVQGVPFFFSSSHFLDLWIF
jgi:hypothetical protein